jgi:hypothetical protein
MPLPDFIDSCVRYFERSGRIIDQPFQARLEEGMVRCYLVRDEVAGFCHQWPRGLLPPLAEDGVPRSRPTMEPATAPAYQGLRAKMEQEWVPQMITLLDLDNESMPVIWDADFLYGPKTGNGEDTFVLCEINVSAVWPYPESATPALARAAATAAIAANAARAR